MLENSTGNARGEGARFFVFREDGLGNSWGRCPSGHREDSVTPSKHEG